MGVTVGHRSPANNMSEAEEKEAQTSSPSQPSTGGKSLSLQSITKALIAGGIAGGV